MDSLVSWISLMSGGYPEVRQGLNQQMLAGVYCRPRGAARGPHPVNVRASVNEQLAFDNVGSCIADVPPVAVLQWLGMNVLERAQVGADERWPMLRRRQ